VQGQAYVLGWALPSYPTRNAFDSDPGFRSMDLEDWQSKTPRAWSISWTAERADIAAPGAPVTIDDAVAALAAQDPKRYGSYAKILIEWSDGVGGGEMTVDVGSGGTLQLPPVTRVEAKLLIVDQNGLRGAVFFGKGLDPEVAPTGEELNAAGGEPVQFSRVTVSGSFDECASSRAVRSASFTQWIEAGPGANPPVVLLQRPSYARDVCVYMSHNEQSGEEEPNPGLLATVRWLVSNGDGTMSTVRRGTVVELYDDVCVPGHAEGLWIGPEPNADCLIEAVWRLAI